MKPGSPVLASPVVLQLVPDHADHDIIANESARVHDLLGCPTKLGLLGDLLAKHVARRQMADAKLVAYPRGLCTLACVIGAKRDKRRVSASSPA